MKNHLFVDASKLELPEEEFVSVYNILKVMKEIKAKEAQEEENEWGAADEVASDSLHRW